MHTFLAFDFGTKNIGVAVGNSIMRQAQPLKTIQHKNVDVVFQVIQKLVKEWEVTHFVVGLPTHPDGAEHEMTHRAKRFGNQLNGRLNLPVQWVDERYTSAVAENHLGDIDSQAAVLILEQYFQETPD
ncbi:putative pre-16S rRNA nuclease [Polynucleobacter sp. SHI8]|uniref:Holliday junction resolvase RuvX n=1 Tax=unclassified Polynucleobacter TaxID=2640945 RepID=UPI00248FCF3F|nr:MULTISPECIES: Holliday junction resolvase RuvX [unclassified Polynucleobacter]BDW10185.1 putative pre-16S rRNA nuclease [Polynucleobacter sp. SHI2]BDW12631.1 putative pre-16S rRNA nuclease [Polynucleobacter sp. SHI8]